MHLVHRGPVAEAAAGEGDKRIGTDDDLAARAGGVAAEAVGEQGAPGVPVLGVQVPAVAGLQLLDRLDLQEKGGVIHASEGDTGRLDCKGSAEPAGAGFRPAERALAQ